MTDLFEIIFRSFWTFIGSLILLTGTVNFTLHMWNRGFRHWNIRKHGYPPPHCDADGDFKPEKEKE